MNTKFRRILDQITSDTKRLFLIDGMGACLTAFNLGVLLVKFEDWFGMPTQALYILSSIACIYAIYSISCYLFLDRNWMPYLKAIVVGNLLYCFISIGIIIHFSERLTRLGWIYFVLEIVVIGSLIMIEREALFKLNRKQTNQN